MHEAFLKNGEKVAVKVQHEWLREESALDIKLVEFLANTGKKLFHDFNYDFLVNDMKSSIPQELDFTIEARNATKILKLFKDDLHIKVPKIYEQYSNVINVVNTRLKFSQWSS